ncbi:hypothetical protein [Streptomyces sp. NPDC024089]|uniref:hypothetical protein n=1 Tax=Streptomyces sp. NPDC024089 TaxID=3154328 RepID=UPI0033D5ADED
MFRSLVADKRMLLVLDNAADTAQVTPLVPGGDTCTVAVAGRNRLSGPITGQVAHQLAVDTLTDTDTDTDIEALGLPEIWNGPSAAVAVPPGQGQGARRCGRGSKVRAAALVVPTLAGGTASPCWSR